MLLGEFVEIFSEISKTLANPFVSNIIDNKKLIKDGKSNERKNLV